MPKASPLIRSFNGGEVSALIEGRTDYEKYPSSCRKLLNYVAAPQGPAIPRSGNMFVARSFGDTKESNLVPFVFDEDDVSQTLMIEFTDSRIRFLNDVGLIVRPAVAATGTGTLPFTFTSAALSAQGAVNGDQVVLNGYASEYNLNGAVANIIAKSGDDYTVDAVYPALALDTSMTISLVYSVASPYANADVDGIVYVQDLDVIYLYHPTKPKYKLKRFDTYNWAFEQVMYIDGPYMDANTTATSLTPSGKGVHNPDMTTDILPANSTAFGSSNTASHEYFRAFDAGDNTSYWESNTAQTGQIGYRNTTPFICDGYSIHLASENGDASYSIKDYAPSTFTLSGSNDGTNYTLIDSKVNYVLYDNNKSAFFELKNATAYQYYRLDIKSLTRNGTQKPRVARLILRSTTSKSLTLTASSVTGINNGQGFLTTDIGRLIRMRGIDGVWRSLRITARSSTTVVTATLEGEPFTSLDPITDWRLGYYSETTGYPWYGEFHQDRLWDFGCKAYPNLVVSSNTGKPEYMAPTGPNGEVLDTNSIVLLLKSRRFPKIKWAREVDKGLLVGSGSKEFLITSVEGTGKVITPATARVLPASSRGSADVDPEAVDNQVVYVQRSGRTLRELAFVYEIDNYKSPSMSLLSSHFGVSPFVELAYAAEPYSIMWARRLDGSVVGMTYNRDENVIGWHSHNFSDGVVRRVAVLPSSDKRQDTLWMVVDRVINGSVRRFIEKLSRFWDVDMGVNDAVFVDCALRYSGSEIQEVYGLSHLEGMDVYGVADGAPFGPLRVTGGKMTLPFPATNIVVGLGYDGEFETSGMENGAADGTAKGKEARINTAVIGLWQSYGGEVGIFNEDRREMEYSPIPYPETFDEVESITLYTGDSQEVVMPSEYTKRKSVAIRRTKDIPLPLNVVYIAPQLNTQDR